MLWGQLSLSVREGVEKLKEQSFPNQGTNRLNLKTEKIWREVGEEKGADFARKGHTNITEL